MLEEAMFTGAFSGWQRVRVHALLVGDRIDLRALYRSDSLAVAPLAIPAGERGMAVLFRYGAHPLPDVRGHYGLIPRRGG
jgi:hypothetical protein